MKIRAGGGALGQEGTPEKTCLVPYANNKDVDQLALLCSLISTTLSFAA